MKMLVSIVFVTVTAFAYVKGKSVLRAEETRPLVQQEVIEEARRQLFEDAIAGSDNHERVREYCKFIDAATKRGADVSAYEKTTLARCRYFGYL